MNTTSTGSRPKAIVTGGGNGIGAAVVTDLLERGFTVTALDLDFAGLGDGDAYLQLRRVDLRDTEQSVRTVESTGPGLELLINAAAIRPYGPLHDLRPETLRDTLEVNVVSMFALLQSAASRMRPGGSILNMSSGAAYGKENLLAYGASKAAVISMTKTAAMELAPRRIRVNAVVPGTTETTMLTEADDFSSTRTHYARNLGGTLLRPSDIAQAVVRVALDPLLTGSVLPLGLLPKQW